MKSDSSKRLTRALVALVAAAVTAVAIGLTVSAPETAPQMRAEFDTSPH